MPYRVTERAFAAPMLIALLAVVWLSAAQPAQAARRSHAEDARIGAQALVLRTAQRLDRNDPPDATDRVAIGKLGECRRVILHVYRCDAQYDIRTYSLTEATEHRTCTETVGVTVSDRSYGRARARSIGGLTCREE